MLGASETIEVPTALAVIILSIALGSAVSFIVWQTKQIIEHGRDIERIETQLNSGRDRISRLEGKVNGKSSE